MPTSKKSRERSSSQRRSHGNASSAHRSDKRSNKSNVKHTRVSSAGSTGSHAPVKQRVNSSGAVGYKSTASVRGRGRYTPSHAAPRKKKGFPVWGVILILLVIAGLGVGGYFVATRLIHPYEGAKVEDGQEVTVVIPEGSSGQEIIQILLDAGVIHSSSDFKKAAQEQHADQSLRSGTYTFMTGSDPSEVVKQLVAGPNSNESLLQMPEGLTIAQTAALVESSLGIPHDEFVNQAKASNYVADYPFLESAGKDSLEGFLYPKTYEFAGKEISADSVIRAMLDQYSAEVSGLDFASAESALSDRYNLTVTDYDILRIASIIEKEAKNEDDRVKISSVFYNRLSNHQKLQSDATMGYETGGVVTADDLKSDSAYNTYKHEGLPPTPICSPSLWAIEAAMQPADTEYFYFFIIEDGVYSNHTFSATYEEHQSAYEAALKEQAAAAGGGEATKEQADAEGGEEAAKELADTSEGEGE